MYYSTKRCRPSMCSCQPCNSQGSSEEGTNLKEDLSNFIDVLKDKVLDVAYDTNYSELSSLLEQQRVDIVTLKSDVVFLKNQVEGLINELDQLKNNQGGI